MLGMNSVHEHCIRYDHVPKIWRGEMKVPNISTEPVTSKISLNTPARVRMRPLPTPTRNTAAILSRNATDALLRRIHGLSKPSVFRFCSGVKVLPTQRS